MDRLDAMQVLLTVVDEGSLSAGGRKLNSPLQTVSRKVAELEQLLGTQLLIRTSRKVLLTDAGRDYVEAARHIVEELKDAEQRASGEYQVPRGNLSVTATLQFGHAVVGPLAYEFVAEHPEITLNLRLLDWQRSVNLIEEKVDVEVHVGALEDSTLVAIHVGDFAAVTCASPTYLERKGHPKRPEELATHDAVNWTQANDQPWPYRRDGKEAEGLPNMRVRVNSPSSALDAAAAGLGLTRVLDFMAEDYLRAGTLVRLFKEYDEQSWPVHLVYVRQGLLPLKVRAFLDWMTPRLRIRLKQMPVRPEAPPI